MVDRLKKLFFYINKNCFTVIFAVFRVELILKFNWNCHAMKNKEECVR